MRLPQPVAGAVEKTAPVGAVERTAPVGAVGRTALVATRNNSIKIFVTKKSLINVEISG